MVGCIECNAWDKMRMKSALMGKAQKRSDAKETKTNTITRKRIAGNSISCAEYELNPEYHRVFP